MIGVALFKVTPGSRVIGVELFKVTPGSRVIGVCIFQGNPVLLRDKGAFVDDSTAQW